MVGHLKYFIFELRVIYLVTDQDAGSSGSNKLHNAKFFVPDGEKKERRGRLRVRQAATTPVASL